MLHKTDNMIVADFILRRLRSDMRLKYIDGFIRPYVNNQEHGYTIDLIKINSQYSISFALNAQNKIAVYINISALSLIYNISMDTKLFECDQFKATNEYIIRSIIHLIKIYKIKTIPAKLDLL